MIEHGDFRERTERQVCLLQSEVTLICRFLTGSLALHQQHSNLLGERISTRERTRVYREALLNGK